jgi:restriction system protein
MRQNERNLAAEILRGAFRFAALPFSWSAAALRRSRDAIPGQSAEYARFDTRKWTAQLLKHLEWRRFEETCAAYFAALDYTTRVAPSRLGGGVDIALCAPGAGAPSIVVQCKPWDAYRIGAKPLRELRAAMTAAGVGEGMLVTSGRFTAEAAAFAARENIRLVDGAALLSRLAELPPEKSAALLKLATQGDFLTPTCPNCAIKMTSRRSTPGGRKFWGCFNYPRCKHTVPGSA